MYKRNDPNYHSQQYNDQIFPDQLYNERQYQNQQDQNQQYQNQQYRNQQYTNQRRTQHSVSQTRNVQSRQAQRPMQQQRPLQHQTQYRGAQYSRGGKRQTRVGVAFSNFLYDYGKLLAILFISLFGIQMITGINVLGFIFNLLFGKFGLVLCLLFILDKVFNFLGTSLLAELKGTLDTCKERKNSKYSDTLNFDDLEEEEEVERVVVDKEVEELHRKYKLNKEDKKPNHQEYKEEPIERPLRRERSGAVPPRQSPFNEPEDEENDWVPRRERKTVREVEDINVGNRDIEDENMKRREAINRAMREMRSGNNATRRNP